MNALYTKIAICGVVLLILGGLYWRLQVVENQRDSAKEMADKWHKAADAWQDTAETKDRYIAIVSQKQIDRDKANADNQKEAENVKNDGCAVLPASFRQFIERLR